MPSTSHTRKDYYTLQELAVALSNIESSKEDVQDDIAAIEHHQHSRWRVYPQDVTSTALIAAAAVANTFGDWALVIPLNTVPFSFDIIGLVVEGVSAAATYFIQLGYNTVNAIPGANMELGERRVRLVTVPIARATEILIISGQDIPANSTIWARLKTDTGVANTANISVVLERHIEVEREVTIYPAFPW